MIQSHTHTHFQTYVELDFEVSHSAVPFLFWFLLLLVFVKIPFTTLSRLFVGECLGDCEGGSTGTEEKDNLFF